MFKAYSPSLKLVTPILTQFGTTFMMMKCLLQVWPILDHMLFDAKWDAYRHSLKGKRNFVGAIKVKHIIHDDKFWARCKIIMTLTKPLFIAMHMFNGSQPKIGITYITMLKVNAHFKQMKDHPSFGMGEEMVVCLEMNFTLRWDLIVIDF